MFSENNFFDSKFQSQIWSMGRWHVGLKISRFRQHETQKKNNFGYISKRPKIMFSENESKILSTGRQIRALEIFTKMVEKLF